MFALHRVMRMVVLSREDEAGLTAAGANAITALYLSGIPRTYRQVVDADRVVRLRMTEISPHCRAVAASTSHLSLSNEACRQLAVVERAGALLDQFLGRYAEAIERFEQALDHFEKAFEPGTNHEEIAVTLAALGNVLSSNGDYESAEVRCNAALEMYDQLYPEGNDVPGLAQALHRAAVVQERLSQRALPGSDEEKTKKRHALARYKLSLEMNRRIYGQDTDHDEIGASCCSHPAFGV